MKAKELVKRLAAFGLDPHEAVVFYHISRIGAARAAEVAQVSGVKRTEIYRVMEALEAKGLVEKTLERPRRFVPLNIETALDRILENRTRELGELKRERDELTTQWPRGAAPSGGVGERFSVHHGRTQIRGLLTRMVDSARDEVLIVALKRGLARLDGMAVFERLTKKAAGGTVVKVLTEIDPTNRGTADAIAAVCSVRHVELPGYHQVVIVDGREIALFVSVDPLVSTSESGETVLWLNSPDFILAQKALFDAMWELGLDHRSRARELDTGAVAEQVQVVRGRWTRYNRMKDMIYRAKDSVTLLTTATDAARLKQAGIAPLLKRRLTDKLDVRVLVAGADPPPLDGVPARRAGADVPMVALAIDDSELLVVMGADEEPASVAYEQEWATWVTLRPVVAHTRAWLEAQWGG